MGPEEKRGLPVVNSGLSNNPASQKVGGSTPPLPPTRAQSFAADTHFLSGFSLADTEPFSFCNVVNCSRT